LLNSALNNDQISLHPLWLFPHSHICAREAFLPVLVLKILNKGAAKEQIA